MSTVCERPNVKQNEELVKLQGRLASVKARRDELSDEANTLREQARGSSDAVALADGKRPSKQQLEHRLEQAERDYRSHTDAEKILAKQIDELRMRLQGESLPAWLPEYRQRITWINEGLEALENSFVALDEYQREAHAAGVLLRTSCPVPLPLVRSPQLLRDQIKDWRKRISINPKLKEAINDE